MNPKSTLALITCCILLFSCKTTEPGPETIRLITQEITQRNYCISVNTAIPLRLPPIQLSSEYDLKIKNDTATAFLPYYGVAQMAPYGTSDSGIKFSSYMKNYRIITNKKNNGWMIQFEIHEEQSRYDVNIDIYDNGNSTLTIRPNNKDAITFHGKMKH